MDCIAFQTSYSYGRQLFLFGVIVKAKPKRKPRGWIIIGGRIIIGFMFYPVIHCLVLISRRFINL